MTSPEAKTPQPEKQYVRETPRWTRDDEKKLTKKSETAKNECVTEEITTNEGTKLQRQKTCRNVEHTETSRMKLFSKKTDNGKGSNKKSYEVPAKKFSRQETNSMRNLPTNGKVDCRFELAQQNEEQRKKQNHNNCAQGPCLIRK